MEPKFKVGDKVYFIFRTGNSFLSMSHAYEVCRIKKYRNSYLYFFYDYTRMVPESYVFSTMTAAWQEAQKKTEEEKKEKGVCHVS